MSHLEALKIMIKKRGVLKAKLTLFEKHVKSVESSISSSGVDRSVIIELEQRVQDLEDLIPNFEDIQSEIDYSIEENEDEYPKIARIIREDMYVDDLLTGVDTLEEAVFVCFTTRAIHLELILSLSTDDFLQAFHRFVSRRGMPAEVFSDNGTTFVKANKDLKSLFNFFKEQNLEISKAVTDMGIAWHFIPVNSPHFGGIWEAGVKSLKNHLKRVLRSYTFFFFDFQTLLVRIEAVLNSRPICPLTSCPNDLPPLTPAHFLLGRAGTAVPEGTVMHLPENRLSQFQLVQKVYEQFWSRWQREYVSELQTRQKWTRNTGSLNIGQLVLIKEDNLPPMRWRMGRILELFSGKDGIARVARIKTTDGIVSRSLVKLCPLPVESSPEDLSRRGACTVRHCLQDRRC
ncbi:uncharacterized protein LOC123322598 isoform X2 [Coccinella septempunctata]|uniref:uncharacterized protein LOC123322598 isoform X1 n=1 Tax=Coccinella septempunctata TaxID=41139 RepID=UPI001D07B2E4|nr:uncharacterized protein LOC123322598 isoform X1 [Coccinella septempunctata]XP_044766483.1 uncharacterized protein LOC123322598 isoform X2 [Coccinella septempunctata]